MPDPTRPKAWANLLSQLWGLRFPVEVERIAIEFSQTKFADPILKIAEADIDRFEGMLAPLRKKGGWAILYNPSIPSLGRRNFTLAHELGHYLVHRVSYPNGFQCGEKDVLGIDLDAQRKQLEKEADEFASYLLMPLDDYRAQVGREDMTLDLLRHCAERYGVSMTAAAIKWLEFTTKSAAIVVATNGFVLWCWRSDAARKRGIYFPKGLELPEGSLAAQPGMIPDDPSRGITLDRTVWGRLSGVREMAIHADRYEMTISLLVFEELETPDFHPDPEVEDTLNRLLQRS